MFVSYKWLSNYVDLTGVSPEDLAEKLTRSGVEVEGIEQRNQGVTSVVVGYVLSREKHPDADKLSVCMVDVGEEEPLQIVCGAKNVAAGQKVPVALVGAKLPGGLKIKKSKLRGVESRGMICSARELGINDKLLPKDLQEGILVLPEELEIGQPIESILGLDDYVLELSLTPNRSDCLSMIGAAYEVGAILNREVVEPVVDIQESEESIEGKVKVAIEAPDACYRYMARLITDVKLAPSPLWMQNLLIAAGIRPINNVVDITNYVMLETGQPLHAFDYERVPGGNIVVRKARAGEKIVTLDDMERELDEEMLLITDGEKPIAIAGVMGGANSEVTENTRHILLESAQFAGGSVRKTSRKLGLRSEASLRFEKETDPVTVQKALDRAAALLAELAGGKVARGIADAHVRPVEENWVTLRMSRLNNLLGTNLSLQEVEDIFTRLSFHYQVDGEMLKVHVPSRRKDITREVDLIEEVARLYGYDNIPTTLPVGINTRGSLTRQQALRRKIRDVLNAMGMDEVSTYSFTRPEIVNDFPALYKEGVPVALSMPMSEERSILRTNLLPHLAETAAYNLNRKQRNISIFEIGYVFITEEETLTELPDEKITIAGLVAGNQTEQYWGQANIPVDFFYVKGILEGLFDRLGIFDVTYQRAQDLRGMHPGRTAEIFVQGQKIGYIGQIHPVLAQKYDIEETYVFQLDGEQIFRFATDHSGMVPLPKYPEITRDIAVVVDREVSADELKQSIEKAAGPLLEKVTIFDVYTDAKIGKEKKSIALSCSYRNPEKTLTDEEVQQVHDQVVAALAKEYGAELRS